MSLCCCCCGNSHWILLLSAIILLGVLCVFARNEKIICMTMMMTIIAVDCDDCELLLLFSRYQRYERSFATNRREFTAAKGITKKRSNLCALLSLSLCIFHLLFYLFIYFRLEMSDVACVFADVCVHELNERSCSRKKTFKLRFTCFVRSVPSSPVRDGFQKACHIQKGYAKMMTDSNSNRTICAL